MTAAIDPGTTTAIAVVDNTRVVATWSGSLLDAFDAIVRMHETHGVTTWFVEDTGRMPTWHYDATDTRKREKVSRNVGMVQRDASLICQLLTRRGYNHYRVKPRGGKWGPAIVEQVTGYDRRTNQHVRDAIRLAWAYRMAEV